MQTDKEMEDERIETIRAKEKLYGLKQTPKIKLRKGFKENQKILDKLIGVKKMERSK